MQGITPSTLKTCDTITGLFLLLTETPLEDIRRLIMLEFQVSTSLWLFFGTSKDFENSSLGIFSFFVCCNTLGILDYRRIVWCKL